jgi:hypothetical protein
VVALFQASAKANAAAKAKDRAEWLAEQADKAKAAEAQRRAVRGVAAAGGDEDEAAEAARAAAQAAHEAAQRRRDEAAKQAAAAAAAAGGASGASGGSGGGGGSYGQLGDDERHLAGEDAGVRFWADCVLRVATEAFSRREHRESGQYATQASKLLALFYYCGLHNAATMGGQSWQRHGPSVNGNGGGSTVVGGQSTLQRCSTYAVLAPEPGGDGRGARGGGAAAVSLAQGMLRRAASENAVKQGGPQDMRLAAQRAVSRLGEKGGALSPNKSVKKSSGVATGGGSKPKSGLEKKSEELDVDPAFPFTGMFMGADAIDDRCGRSLASASGKCNRTTPRADVPLAFVATARC